MSIRITAKGQRVGSKRGLNIKSPSVAVAKPGSLSFNGTVAGQLNFSNSPNINLGTGDYTAEWWQYQTDSNGAPRPWGIGAWSNTQLGVSLETGFYVWYGSSIMNFGTYGSIKNQWVHFAVVRQSGVVKVYKNGVAINGGTGLANTYSINSGGTYHLTLGGEGGSFSSQTFGGNITNFRITNTAVYTSNFTPSTAPLTAITGTVVLISAKDEATKFDVQGTYTGTATPNSNVTWSSSTPF